MPNTVAELDSPRHPPRCVKTTLRIQLVLARYNSDPKLPPVTLQAYHDFLIAHISDEYPSALAYFANLGSHPFNLYRIVSFHQLHDLFLDIILHFCDLTHNFIRHSDALPRSRSMKVINGRFIVLTTYAKVGFKSSFRSTTDYAQICISCGIRRESVSFLFVTLMGVWMGLPDEEKLLKTTYEFINTFMCSPYSNIKQQRLWR